MRLPKRASANRWDLRGLALLASLSAAAAACGASSEGPPAAGAESKGMDKTEVTMVLAPGDAGSGQDLRPSAPPGAASSAPTASSSAPSNDPSDVAMIGGPQDPEIEKAIAPVRPRIRACYKKALAAEPNVGGTATFDCTIGKEGHVASVRPVKRDGLNDDMVGCLTTSLRAMTFEGPKKSQIVALTFGTPTGAGTSSASAPDAGAKR